MNRGPGLPSITGNSFQYGFPRFRVPRNPVESRQVLRNPLDSVLDDERVAKPGSDRPEADFASLPLRELRSRGHVIEIHSTIGLTVWTNTLVLS